MVLGATRHNVDTALDKGGSHGLGILDHLLLVGFVLGGHGFFKADGLGGNHVHQRAALAAGEHCRVEFFLNLFVGLGENNTAARTAQGFVGSGGGNVGNLHRVRV